MFYKVNITPKGICFLVEIRVSFFFLVGGVTACENIDYIILMLPFKIEDFGVSIQSKWVFV